MSYKQKKSKVGSLDDVTRSTSKKAKPSYRSTSADDTTRKSVVPSTPSKLEKTARAYCSLITQNPGEAWEKRVDALQKLKFLFDSHAETPNDTSIWTKPLFNILIRPIESQIIDLRSNITKEIGAVLVSLAKAANDAVGPFFLSIQPSIFSTLNSGNKVIQGHMDDAMKEALEHVRSKKYLSGLIRELKDTKSVLLRQTLAGHLVVILNHWGGKYLTKDSISIVKATEGCLNDGNSTVRTIGREIFQMVQTLFPAEAGGLFSRLDGRARKAIKLGSVSEDVGFQLEDDENTGGGGGGGGSLRKFRRRTTTANEQILESAAKSSVIKKSSSSSLKSNSSSNIVTKRSNSGGSVETTANSMESSNKGNIKQPPSPTTSEAPPPSASHVVPMKAVTVRERVPTEEMILLGIGEGNGGSSGFGRASSIPNPQRLFIAPEDMLDGISEKDNESVKSDKLSTQSSNLVKGEDYHIIVDDVDAELEIEAKLAEEKDSAPFRLTDDTVPVMNISPPPKQRDRPDNLPLVIEQNNNDPPLSPSLSAKSSSSSTTASSSSNHPVSPRRGSRTSRLCDRSVKPPPSTRRRSEDDVMKKEQHYQGSSLDEKFNSQEEDDDKKEKTSTSPSCGRINSVSAPPVRPVPSRRRTSDGSKSPKGKDLHKDHDNQFKTLHRRRSSKKLNNNIKCEESNQVVHQSMRRFDSEESDAKPIPTPQKITRGGSINKPDSMEVMISLAKARELLTMDMMDEKTKTFINSQVVLQPYGVLGKRLTIDGQRMIEIGCDPTHRRRRPGDPPPGPTICVLDSAGLHHIQPPGKPKGAKGASGALYNWLGIDLEDGDGLQSTFPKEVIKTVQNVCDAKFHVYHRDGSIRRSSYLNVGDRFRESIDDNSSYANITGAAYVIHSCGPDFRSHPAGKTLNEKLALDTLARTYYFILYEFIQSGTMLLRLLPISSGIFVGPFRSQLPLLTFKALQIAFASLKEYDQNALLKLEVHMCIYAESQFNDYILAGFQPSLESRQRMNSTLSVPTSANTSIMNGGSGNSRAPNPPPSPGTSISSFTHTDYDDQKTSFSSSHYRKTPTKISLSATTSRSFSGGMNETDILFDRYKDAIEKNPIKKNLLLVDLKLDAQAWIRQHTNLSPSSSPLKSNSNEEMKSFHDHLSSQSNTSCIPSSELKNNTTITKNNNEEEEIGMQTRKALLDVLKIQYGIEEIGGEPPHDDADSATETIKKQKDYIQLLESIIVKADFPRSMSSSNVDQKGNQEPHSAGQKNPACLIM